jgi:hypothetical protein
MAFHTADVIGSPSASPRPLIAQSPTADGSPKSSAETSRRLLRAACRRPRTCVPKRELLRVMPKSSPVASLRQRRPLITRRSCSVPLLGRSKEVMATVWYRPRRSAPFAVLAATRTQPSSFAPGGHDRVAMCGLRPGGEDVVVGLFESECPGDRGARGACAWWDPEEVAAVAAVRLGGRVDDDQPLSFRRHPSLRR